MHHEYIAIIKENSYCIFRMGMGGEYISYSLQFFLFCGHVSFDNKNTVLG